jgi:ribose transport system ATP-binding protein
MQDRTYIMKAQSESKTPLLRMQGIVKSFPGVKALRGVSLELHRGHVLAIVGENGAGKSSLVKTLSGAYEPDEGSIEIDGAPLARGTNAAIDAGVAVIYQELSLINDMTVAENLFLGRMPSASGFVKQREAHAMAREALARVGLDNVPPWQRLGDLPLNKRQLVEVAKAIARDARILVMDEPTAALQSHDIENLYAVVRRLREAGMGIIFISHHLEEVFELADSAVVMRDGATVGARRAQSGIVLSVGAASLWRSRAGSARSRQRALAAAREFFGARG